MSQLWTKQQEAFLRNNYQEMTDDEIADAMGKTKDGIRRKMERMKLERNEKEFIPKEIEKRKGQMIIKEKDLLINKLLDERAKNGIILDILRTTVSQADFTPQKLYPKNIRKGHEEEMILHLTDVHIGCYSEEVLKEKIDKLFSAVTQITQIHRSAYSIRKLNIFMTGDIVDGDGIFPGQSYEQKFYLMQQIFTFGAPHMANLLNRLSEHFEEVEIHCVRGNHGRKDKFTDPQINFDNVFYEVLRMATGKNARIKWNITWDWYNYATIQKTTFMLIHGNQIKTWLNLPFYGLKEKAMRWKGSMPQDFRYVFMGHYHTNLYFEWNNFEAYTAGTWKDRDAFAEEVLGMKSSTTQKIYGIHDGRLTFNYPINLSV